MSEKEDHEIRDKVIEVETTLAHLKNAMQEYAARENDHYHRLQSENRDQESRIRRLEERHDERFQALERRVFMGIGALAAFQFIITIAIGMLSYIKK